MLVFVNGIPNSVLAGMAVHIGPRGPLKRIKGLGFGASGFEGFRLKVCVCIYIRILCAF